MVRCAPRPIRAISWAAIAWATTLVAVWAETEATTAEVVDALVATPLETDAEYGFRAGSPIAVPIPFNNPTIGAGLTLLGGYLFQQDAGSGTSFLGLAGFQTESGNIGGGAIVRFSAQDNQWQSEIFVGAADLTYDVRTFGGDISVDQEMTTATAELRYGLTPEFSAGLTGGYVSTQLAPSELGRDAPLLAALGDLSLGSLGLVAEWDALDDDVFPTAGTAARLDLSRTMSVNEGSLDYIKALLDLRHYRPVGARSALAMKLGLCGAGDDTPFFDSCLLGGPDGIRGYGYFDYHGTEMVIGQIEYRQRFAGRVGLAAFVGAGEVFASKAAQESGLRLAGGVGARVTVSKDFGVDLSLDVTTNDRQDTLVYLYVGQGF